MKKCNKIPNPARLFTRCVIHIRTDKRENTKRQDHHKPAELK